MIHSVLFVLLGFAVGVLSGIVGLGGGIFIIPALVFLFGMSQHQAQGTTLAILVPPIGLLAAWTYYRQGYVDLRAAALVCLGFFFGGFLGAKIAVSIPNELLRKVFGSTLILVGIKMVLGR